MFVVSYFLPYCLAQMLRDQLLTRMDDRRFTADLLWKGTVTVAMIVYSFSN